MLKHFACQYFDRWGPGGHWCHVGVYRGLLETLSLGFIVDSLCMKNTCYAKCFDFISDVFIQEIGSPEVQKIIDDMIAVMRKAPGVGLAAPQIGVGLQVRSTEARASSHPKWMLQMWGILLCLCVARVRWFSFWCNLIHNVWRMTIQMETQYISHILVWGNTKKWIPYAMCIQLFRLLGHPWIHNLQII